jgi:hypothetical protein
MNSDDDVKAVDPRGKPDVQSISEIISDALMRANTMTACVVIYTDKEGSVCTNFSASRVERLGMLTHVLFHEQALSVRDVDDYESETGEDD